MDSRTNGHGDHDGRPRLPADGRAPRRSSVDSLRAADQLARLEARIREFHRNLDALESATAGSDPVPRTSTDSAPRTSTDSAPRLHATSRTGAGPKAGAEADDLVRRAAAAARLAISHGEGTVNGSPPAPVTNGDTGHRRRRSDRSTDPVAPLRRIDALRPDPRPLTAVRPALTVAPPEPTDGARGIAEQIRRDAESDAEQLRREAESAANRVQDATELEMQELWEALESEVETIQTEISQRVDSLAVRMEAVSREADLMRVLAEEEAEQIHHAALAEADQIRALASHDVDELLSLAEREAHALIAEARAQAESLLTEAETHFELLDSAPEPEWSDPVAGRSSRRDPERGAAERIAEQIRDATAALTRRVSRAVEDPPPTRAREIRGPAIVPASIRELLDGLVSAVSLIERSLIGLADLLGDTLGAEPLEDR